MEVLSRLANSLGLIKGFIIARGVSLLHHLFFADDVFLFGKATSMEATQFKECLDTFCAWSGQSFNSHKSNFFVSRNTRREMELRLTDILQFERIAILSHYLGLPLFRSKKISDFYFYWISLIGNWQVGSPSFSAKLNGVGIYFQAPLLCLSILRGKYFRDNSFLMVTAYPSDSLFWKGLLVVKPLVLLGACMQVGDGSRVDI